MEEVKANTEENTVSKEQFDALQDKFNSLMNTMANLTTRLEQNQSQEVIIKKEEEPAKSGDEAFIDWFKNT